MRTYPVELDDLDASALRRAQAALVFEAKHMDSPANTGCHACDEARDRIGGVLERAGVPLPEGDAL